MKILVIDNYDSFTYNLVQILQQLPVEKQIEVKRNDQFELDEVEAYDKILLSPGPGIPKDAGRMPQIIERYSRNKSILGICLGHQGIAENFGGSLSLMKKVKHGVASSISLQNHDSIFQNLPQKIQAGHYHSWCIDSYNLPKHLEVTATDDDGNIMAIKHREHNCRGVQFHPESILTPQGKQIINNWINI